MGRKSNVNPDHYKTAGREKPGQAVHHEANRQKYAEAMQQQKEAGYIPGQNTEEKPSHDNQEETESTESGDSAK